MCIRDSAQGAGGCFLATFVYGVTKGYDHTHCLELAVKGATEAVKHVGTHTLTVSDIEERIVFTNGCFDILHTGHFELLAEAKSLGAEALHMPKANDAALTKDEQGRKEQSHDTGCPSHMPLYLKC